MKLAPLLLTIKTEKDMKRFLEGILTTKEYEEIETRIKIIAMLKKNIPQAVIAKGLGIGVATVTRGSKEMQKGMFTDINLAIILVCSLLSFF
jgi:TrpR family transcriptional regulator, trp operon repressor